MADVVFERLADYQERAEFSCGQVSLDRFIREQAGQYERRGLGRTYVALEKGGRRVVAYYTLAASATDVRSLPEKARKKLPKHPIPVILLGRLAIDQTVQGRGLGGELLVDAFKSTALAADIVGVFAIIVSAIDDSAQRFYEKFGFVPFVDRPLNLFLPMPDVRAAIRPLG
jgi:GNAT superfamily N-acetyltransferase